MADRGSYARESSRPSRAAYRLVTRRRRASGDGHSATSAPPIPSAPPIQIQATNGDTIRRKSAGGGLLRYELVIAPITSACTLDDELPNFRLAVVIGPLS